MKEAKTDGGQHEAPKSDVAAPADERRDQRKGRRAHKTDPNPAAESIAQADEEAAIEIASEPAPVPKAQPGRRHRPADNAPTLPLQPIEAEELAARPKAEAFRELGLNEQILADLASMGFEKPSPIQAAAIPVVTNGKDLIGQAMTGTGKTAAFSLPVLNRLYSLEGNGPVALVLCPTRELARQVHHEVNRMAGTSGARSALIYGGVGMDDQIEALSRNPHIVIGTPGRLIDHLKRKISTPAAFKWWSWTRPTRCSTLAFFPTSPTSSNIRRGNAKPCSSRPPCRMKSSAWPTIT